MLLIGHAELSLRGPRSDEWVGPWSENPRQQLGAAVTYTPATPLHMAQGESKACVTMSILRCTVATRCLVDSAAYRAAAKIKTTL